MIASFRKPASSSNNEIEYRYEYRYIVPFRCKKNISKILEALISTEIISEESYITTLTTYSCKVMIKDSSNRKTDYDKLFSRMDLLLQTDFISCDTDPVNGIVKVVYNDLSVRDLDCQRMHDDGYDLLDFFYEKGYLINMTYNKIAKKQVLHMRHLRSRICLHWKAEC